MMFSKDLVTIVIPTYNRGHIIKRAIFSLLEQDYKHIEIIVVDDESTDNTKDIIASIDNKKIKYFKIDKSGACAARNRGIIEATGRYITFLDSDDTYCVNKISMQLNQLKNNNADFVFCSFIRNVDNFQEKIPSNLKNKTVIDYKDLLYGNFISTQTIFGKADVLKKEMFDESFPRFHDWDLAYRLTKKYKVIFFDKVLVNQYIQKDSIYYNNDSYFDGMIKFIIKNINDYSNNKDILYMMLQNLVYQAKNMK